MFHSARSAGWSYHLTRYEFGRERVLQNEGVIHVSTIKSSQGAEDGSRSASSQPPRLSDRDVRFRRLRRDSICLGLDLIVLAIAFCGAFLVRYEGRAADGMVDAMLWNLPWVVLLQYAMLAWQQVPRFSWVFIGIRDVPPIVNAFGAAALVMLTVRYGGGLLSEPGSRVHGLLVPSSVVVFDAAFGILGIAGVRGLRRLQRERMRMRHARVTEKGTPTVLIGAGVAGRMLQQELDEFANLGYRPVAFLDDDREKLGRLVGGIRVEGTTAQLTEVARRHGAKVALIAIASADRADVHRILEHCKSASLQTKMIPSLHEIVTGKIRITQLRDVAIEDLLGREPIEIEGSNRGHLWHYRDVTARRAAERAAHASDARANAAITAALDSVISIDLTGRVVEFNPAAEHTFGYTRSDAIGRQLAELIVPERFREVLRNGLAVLGASAPESM